MTKKLSLIILLCMLVGFGVGGLLGWSTTRAATLNLNCHNEIMPIAPEGESVLKLPEGWHYAGNMGDLILIQREVCE